MIWLDDFVSCQIERIHLFAIVVAFTTMTTEEKQPAIERERVKIVFVGDGAVGKTCLIQSYAYNNFPGEYIPTVFDNFNFDFTVNDREYEIGAWDTAGQIEYDRLRPLSYPHTDIFVICFSLLDRASLESIEKRWIPELEHHLPGKPIFIAGCKDDFQPQVKSKAISNKANAVVNEDWPQKDILIHGYTRSITQNIKMNIPFELLDVIGMYLGSLKIHFDAQKLCNSYDNVYGYFPCSAMEDRGLRELFQEIMVFHTTPEDKRDKWIKQPFDANQSDKGCCVIT